MIKNNDPNYYLLLSQADIPESENKKIEVDIKRLQFSQYQKCLQNNNEKDFKESCYRILKAYFRRNPIIGYCQGFHNIVAKILSLGFMEQIQNLVWDLLFVEGYTALYKIGFALIQEQKSIFTDKSEKNITMKILKFEHALESMKNTDHLRHRISKYHISKKGIRRALQLVKDQVQNDLQNRQNCQYQNEKCECQIYCKQFTKNHQSEYYDQIVYKEKQEIKIIDDHFSGEQQMRRKQISQICIQNSSSHSDDSDSLNNLLIYRSQHECQNKQFKQEQQIENNRKSINMSNTFSSEQAIENNQQNPDKLDMINEKQYKVSINEIKDQESDCSENDTKQILKQLGYQEVITRSSTSVDLFEDFIRRQSIMIDQKSFHQKLADDDNNINIQEEIKSDNNNKNKITTHYQSDKNQDILSKSQTFFADFAIFQSKQQY